MQAVSHQVTVLHGGIKRRSVRPSTFAFSACPLGEHAMTTIVAGTFRISYSHTAAALTCSRGYVQQLDGRVGISPPSPRVFSFVSIMTTSSSCSVWVLVSAVRHSSGLAGRVRGPVDGCTVFP